MKKLFAICMAGVDADVALMASHWQQSGTGWAEGDFNGDGVVDDSDITLLAANWQAGAAVEAGVPEPSLCVLLTSLLAFFIIYNCRFNPFQAKEHRQ